MKRKVILNEFEFSSLLDKVVSYVKSAKDKVSSYFSDDDESEDSSYDDSGSYKKGKKDDIKVSGSNTSDDEIYKKILTGIGAPHTKENMKFFYAWRQAEGGKAKYNPFNTTKKMEGSTFYNCLKRKSGKCSGGVRNYKSESQGVDATIKTLKLDFYDCITDGLKGDIGARKISRKCRKELKTWGTGDLVATVLDGKSLKPTPISSSEIKTAK